MSWWSQPRSAEAHRYGADGPTPKWWKDGCKSGRIFEYEDGNSRIFYACVKTKDGIKIAEENDWVIRLPSGELLLATHELLCPK